MPWEGGRKRPLNGPQVREVQGAVYVVLPLVFAAGAAVRGFQAADGLSALNLYGPVPGPRIVLEL